MRIEDTLQGTTESILTDTWAASDALVKATKADRPEVAEGFRIAAAINFRRISNLARRAALRLKEHDRAHLHASTPQRARQGRKEGSMNTIITDLLYIIHSPPRKYGGFSRQTIDTAKSAVNLIWELLVLSKQLKEALAHYKNHPPPHPLEGHETSPKAQLRSEPG